MNQNILNEMTKLYEKNATEKFEIFKNEESVAIKRKMYDKYYQDALDSISDIDCDKVELEIQSIEDEVNRKVEDIQTVQDTFQSTLPCVNIEELKEVIGTECGGLDFSGILSDYKKKNQDVRSTIEMISTKLDNLLSERTDSIKKEKQFYENQMQDAHLKNLSKNLHEKHNQHRVTNDNITTLLKKLNEKKETSEDNTRKINSLKAQLDEHQVKIQKETEANNTLISEETELKKESWNLEEQLKQLQRQIKQKKTEHSDKFKNRLLLMTNDDIADKANRNLLMENMQLIKEIESSSMECQDYLSHLKINACQEEIRQKQRSLILNMFACMCLAKVKILKIEQSKKDSNTIEGFVDDMNGNIVDMVNQLEEGRNKLLEEEGKFSERKRQVEVMTRKQRKYSDILKYKLK